jgi:hypothetical protein
MIHSWCNWDNVYSFEDFKMGILASNAYNPGFCPMILNLVSSSAKITSANNDGGLWVIEYAHGLEQEIYCVNLKFNF